MAKNHPKPPPLKYQEVMRLLDTEKDDNGGQEWWLTQNTFKNKNSTMVTKLTPSMFARFVTKHDQFVLLESDWLSLDRNYREHLRVFRTERDQHGNYVLYELDALKNPIRIRNANTNSKITTDRTTKSAWWFKEFVARFPPGFRTITEAQMNEVLKYTGFVTFLRTPKYYEVIDTRSHSAAATIQAAVRGMQARRRYQGLLDKYYAPGGRGAVQAIGRAAAAAGGAAPPSTQPPRRRQRRRQRSRTQQRSEPMAPTATRLMAETPMLRGQTTWRIPVGGSRTLIR